MSQTRRHPDASFHGRIIPTSSIAFFTSRGGVCEYPLCLCSVCLLTVRRLFARRLHRCSVSVVFWCVPVYAPLTPVSRPRSSVMLLSAPRMGSVLFFVCACFSLFTSIYELS